MRTKLSFIANNDLEALKKDCEFCAEHGFEGLEFNYWGTFQQLTEKTVNEMARVLQQSGLRCVMLGLWGWNHLAPDQEERTKAHDMLGKAIDFGTILEADVLTTGGGVFNESLEDNVREFLQVFPPYVQRVLSAGMTPAFYATHGKSFFDSLEAYERVWESMPDVRIKYDPANWKHHGQDYLEVLRKHGDKVGHVHIKEHLYHKGELASQPPAGMGDVEWGKVFAFLYEHNYDGPFSIEPHGPVWSKGDMRRKMLLLTQRTIAPLLL